VDQLTVNHQPLDLHEYLEILWRRKWTILMIAVLAVASALVFSFRQTPIYSSSAQVLVKPPTANQTAQNVPTSTLISMDTEKTVAESAAVAEIAAKRLKIGMTVGELDDQLDVSVPTNTQVLEITFSNADPILAQRGAEAFAQAYLDFRSSQAVRTVAEVTRRIRDQVVDLQRQLDEARQALATAKPDSVEVQQAQSDIDSIPIQIGIYKNQLSAIATTSLDPGEVIRHADLPTSPSSPRIPLNAALALFVGLALGVGLAFLRERLDDRISGRDTLEEAAGAPVLALIPRIEGWRKKNRAELPAAQEPKGAPAEAYRTIRTNLLFMAKDGDLKTIAVSSASAGEGKTTTAANLAVSLAQADKRVIVISADLRKPRLHKFFNLNNETGLSGVLAHRYSIYDAVQRPTVEGVRVMASGPVPPNPAELLASDEMDVLLDQLREVADFVIIDTPPVLAVSDVMSLAPRADGVIIIADAQSTHRGAVAHLRDQLAQVGGNVIGAVLNNFDPARAKYYPAYYRYQYTYRDREARGGKEAREPREAVGSGRSLDGIWRRGDIWNGGSAPVPPVPTTAKPEDRDDALGDSWSLQ
jgi:tyrosine-protein kinase